MSDVLILDLGTTIVGNCMVTGYAAKIIVLSYSHSASMPLQMDASNTERTSGRPVFSELSFSKMSDLSTTEMYKACTQGTKIGLAKLHVGRVENGKYMNFFTYEMTNAMISNISTSGGGGIPSDSFSLNFTKIKCDYTQQQADSTAKGTGTWNWNLETMKAD
ncbi:virulence factor secretion apparatus protein [Janthinobacterium sp. HH01]|uniref:Hcp family type VI secretion system effector n=1 Tax=Janthinobacterium sp. HH01 TaxID=1198452 RepID=UPI0002AEC111|nr:type VI secretion system tube protein Hcp [Janthinobacterium sp. HH01]ELX12950.1 virulence factor secretion apparatus protein [Janthinobacterium sp. HH01]